MVRREPEEDVRRVIERSHLYLEDEQIDFYDDERQKQLKSAPLKALEYDKKDMTAPSASDFTKKIK